MALIGSLLATSLLGSAALLRRVVDNATVSTLDATEDTSILYKPVAIDEVMLMPRTLPNNMQHNNCLDGWNPINPSIVKIDGTDETLVAFRGLCMVKPDAHAQWYSNLVIGTTSDAFLRGQRGQPTWKNLSIVPDPRMSHDPSLKECQMANLDHAEGPEDPRLIKANGKIFIIVTGYNTVKTQSNQRPECDKLGFLLHAAEVTHISPIRFGPPVKLTFEGMGMVEKNWAMFHPENVNGMTYAVYSIFPHKIVSVDLESGEVKFAHETPSPAVGELADSIGAQTSWFHGGAGIAEVSSNGQRYFLSIMHASSPPGEEVPYRNWPYKFSAKPPFEILEVGTMLPLSLGRNPAYGDAVAFVTSVLYDQGDVFIGYGSGDTSARSFRMSLGEFERRYFP